MAATRKPPKFRCAQKTSFCTKLRHNLSVTSNTPLCNVAKSYPPTSPFLYRCDTQTLQVFAPEKVDQANLFSF